MCQLVGRFKASNNDIKAINNEDEVKIESVILKLCNYSAVCVRC